MAGQIAVPDDFDRMGGAEIEQPFGGGRESAVGEAMLVAQSAVEGILLLTAEPIIAQYAGAVRKV
jgi:hypothetical protein